MSPELSFSSIPFTTSGAQLKKKEAGHLETWALGNYTLTCNSGDYSLLR